MRVEEQVVVDAPAEQVWDYITEPLNYTRFMTGITRWETTGDKDRGLGARYEMRMRIGSADVGGLIEIVEFDPPRDMAWTSLAGPDQRGRWRLRTQDDGTAVTLRLSYRAPGSVLGVLADRFSARLVSRNLRRSLEQLKARLEDGRSNSSAGGRGPLSAVADGLHAARVFQKAGLVRPVRPDKLVRSGLILSRMGPTPAAGFASAAVHYPDEPALIDELGSLTFGEVHGRTNALAHGLAEAGIGPGVGVAIMCRDHRGFVEATIAVSKLGANALYLNTAFAGPQLAEVVKREKPRALVYDEEFAELLAEAGKRRKRFVAWHDADKTADPTLDELIASGDESELDPPPEPGRVVILTSGTTGTPKGAQREAAGLGPAVSLLSRIPIRARGMTVIAAPLFHSWGFAHFSLGLLLSSTSVLRRRFDAEATLAAIERHRASVLVVVPIMLQRMLDLPTETRRRYDTSSLRVVAASGSALPGELAERFMDEYGEVLYNLYGSTEVAWATIATPIDLRAAPGTAGTPPRGTMLKIIDESGFELPPGRTGRIFVGNELLFEGYTGGGGKQLIGGLMSTGDVGYVDEAGRLFVQGRDDEMIVSGGENVFPREVEDLLARHEAVAEVAVIGVPDEEFGQRLKAFIVKQPGADLTASDVKAYVKANLARFKVPRDVEFIDELPRNPTGKVLKRELA